MTGASCSEGRTKAGWLVPAGLLALSIVPVIAGAPRLAELGIGAGTPVLTHIPWFMFPATQGELARTICMGAGWLINIGVAEWVIARVRRQGTPYATLR